MDPSKQTIMYGTTWCGDCARAKRFLDQRGIAYTWIDIEQDEAARAYVEQVNKGLRRVPTIIFPDGSVLVEPSNAQLSQAIERLGLG